MYLYSFNSVFSEFFSNSSEAHFWRCLRLLGPYFGMYFGSVWEVFSVSLGNVLGKFAGGRVGSACELLGIVLEAFWVMC